MTWQEVLYDFITYAVFTYSVVLLGFYVFIGLYSIGETKKYLHKNSFTDYTTLASSQYLPSLSILAPAYNEGANIIENVRSLLSIYYTNLEVIIINDGSKDDSLAKLIKAYDLEKIDFFVRYQIKTKEVRGIYKSKNPVYKKLVVVDKVNGGKADALNVGVNIAVNDYIVCIDVDCILEQDALLKLVKPFIEEPNTKVIATGGVVRIANSCIIEKGKLLKIGLPKDYLPRIQALEYIRAFLLGRMAWSRMNGLMLISGAFGAFDKEIVIKCGGYDHGTVGEDMELVVRMRRYMEESGQKDYKVAFIPDPLCWTEAPVSYKILGRQRNRWTRGTIETLQLHKKMFFNPKYRTMGMLSYPYWFFFEMCAPAIEFLGFIALLVMTFFGVIDWPVFLSFLLFIIMFGYVYSSFAIFMEVITYNQYRKKSDIFKLLLTALSEPFVFHPFVVWSGVKGYIDKIKKKSSWGEMTRTGLGAATAPKPQPAVVQSVAEAQIGTTPVLVEAEETVVEKESVSAKLIAGTKEFVSYLLVFTLLFVLARAFEIIRDITLHGTPKELGKVIGYGLLKDLAFVFSSSLWVYLGFTVLYLLHKKIARVFFVSTAVIVLIIQLSLANYFLATLVLLGADVWAYSWNDIKQTVGASGALNTFSVIAFFIVISLMIVAFIKLPKRFKVRIEIAIWTMIIAVIASSFHFSSSADAIIVGEDYSNNLSTNKSHHFIKQTIIYLRGEDGIDIYADAYSGDFADGRFVDIAAFKYIDEKNYPFLHTVDTADVLSPFFDQSPTPPNIVIIAVEGLGRAFTNEGAYLGNWTPFIDSLSKKSLYWENFIAASGRTFGLLPSLTASAPYGDKGFTELGDKMPEHLSIMSVLNKNGYRSSFYYGGDSRFDNMHLFLKKNGTAVNDEFNFAAGYTKMPQSDQGFSWGYGDKELIRRYLNTNQQQPFFDFILTVSTHSPFLINDQKLYHNKFEERMNALGFDDEKKSAYRRYKDQYASILYADDAVRNLIEQYKQKPQFANTVFIITGDHRMPEIPMRNKLDRYHVPFIVYSPLLNRTAKFSSISTHLDVAPSLLNWLRKSYGMQTPQMASWIGSGIDTAKKFRNIHSVALIQTKLEMVDQLMGEYLLNAGVLYKISANMELAIEKDAAKRSQAEAAFNSFKQKNSGIKDIKSLVPDTLYRKFK